MLNIAVTTSNRSMFVSSISTVYINYFAVTILHLYFVFLFPHSSWHVYTLFTIKDDFLWPMKKRKKDNLISFWVICLHHQSVKIFLVYNNIMFFRGAYVSRTERKVFAKQASSIFLFHEIFKCCWWISFFTLEARNRDKQ